jgi:protein gp37
MGETSIEWTRGDDGTPGRTWNLFRGCRRKSTGCEHCFAEGIAARFSGPGMPFEGFAEMTEHGPRWTGKGALIREKLVEPLSWRKPCRVFVNSMSDLWFEEFANEEIAAAFGVMMACPQHDFQILTKRIERAVDWFAWLASMDGLPSLIRKHPEMMRDYFAAGSKFETYRGRRYRTGKDAWAQVMNAAGVSSATLHNAWIGTSIENRATLGRLDHLRKVPAAVRFVSFEPLLEDLGPIDLTGIDWVIVGSESGHGARPMNEDWIRSLRDQCQAQRVRFFYKQRLNERGRKVSLPVLDGRQWAEFPEARP